MALQSIVRNASKGVSRYLLFWFVLRVDDLAENNGSFMFNFLYLFNVVSLEVLSVKDLHLFKDRDICIEKGPSQDIMGLNVVIF